MTQPPPKPGLQVSTPATAPTLDEVRSRGWVTLRGFTKIADITYPTALRWVKLGMINYVQVGGSKRIYEEEIARFLTYGTLPPDPQAFAEEKAKRASYREHAASERAEAIRNRR